MPSATKANAMIRYIRKCLAILPGVLGIGFGIECIVLAGWGCDPITNFDVGISMHFPISIGMSDMLLGCICFLVAFFFRREWLNLGSFVFCFGTGFSIDRFHQLFGAWGEAVTVSCGIPARIGFIFVGVFSISLALAYYIPINFGYAHWDIMAMFVAEAAKKSYGTGLTVVYIFFFAVSLILGADFGIGTVAATFVPGWLADRIMPKTKRFSHFVAGIREES